MRYPSCICNVKLRFLHGITATALISSSSSGRVSVTTCTIVLADGLFFSPYVPIQRVQAVRSRFGGFAPGMGIENPQSRSRAIVLDSMAVRTYGAEP